MFIIVGSEDAKKFRILGSGGDQKLSAFDAESKSNN